MAKYKKPLRRSFLAGIIGFILVLCLVLSVVQTAHYREMYFHQYRHYIENVLSFVSSAIDVDDLSRCMETGEESEKFHKLQTMLDHIRENVNIHFIYVILPLNTEPVDNMKNVIAGVSRYEYDNMADQLVTLNMLTGDAYSPKTAKKYLDAYNAGKLAFFEERSRWGDDYTGLLPLYDSQGIKVAALCVDIDILQIHEEIWKNVFSMVGMILLLGVGFAVAFTLWASRNLTAPIEQLENSVALFTASCDDQKDPETLVMDVPLIQTDNEVASLARAVSRMSKAVRGYVRKIVYTESELARMIVLANKDALTSVRNKNAYDAYAIELESKMRGGELRFAILMADLNDLKLINDTYGHENGDIYIQCCCRLICDIFDHSPVFRIGGDEFVVVLHGQDYENRAELIEKARAAFRASSLDSAISPWERCSVSIGIAEYQPDTDNRVDAILARADKDMYAEKERIKADDVAGL